MLDFTQLPDLASERVGGNALLASDEFFAGKENLLKPGRGEFIPGKYTENGKWMDGWESRRKRVPGYDWCIVELGMPGVIYGVDIDTNHFLGNFPQHASIEGFRAERFMRASELAAADGWKPLLPQSALKGGSQNLFAIDNRERWTHVRLNIFPDGGVARLRVHGVVSPDWERISAVQKLVDLAAIENGGRALTASDDFFSHKSNLIMPGRSVNMGDGWESRRSRGRPPEGHDWIVVQLGRAGRVRKLELDTNFFKGNYPDSAQVMAARIPGFDPNSPVPPQDFDPLKADWKELLPRTKLDMHRRHHFEGELKDAGVITHVRLNIFPDGGVSRMRVWGELA